MKPGWLPTRVFVAAFVATFVAGCERLKGTPTEPTKVAMKVATKDAPAAQAVLKKGSLTSGQHGTMGLCSRWKQ